MLPPYNKSSVTTTNRHQHRPYGISLFSSYIFNYFNNKWIWIAALLFGLLIVNVNAIDELHIGHLFVPIIKMHIYFVKTFGTSREKLQRYHKIIVLIFKF